MVDPVVPTKLDHTLARKKTEKAAAAAPLLALLGLTPVYTAQAQAEHRVESRAVAERHFAETEERQRREVEEARVHVLGLVGPVALLAFEDYMASSPFLSKCGPSTVWAFWVTARTRARRGEPLFEAWTPGQAKPRILVDDEAALAVIAASPVPMLDSHVADALQHPGWTLDVSDAVRRLRDAGRVVPVDRRGRFVGFTTPERAL